MMRCMVELGPLSCSRNGKCVAEWLEVEVELSKCLGQRVSCSQALVGAVGVSGLVLMFRKREGRGAGSEQLHYLGYRGAIYLRGLTCFCQLGELCSMENR